MNQDITEKFINTFLGGYEKLWQSFWWTAYRVLIIIQKNKGLHKFCCVDWEVQLFQQQNASGYNQNIIKKGWQNIILATQPLQILTIAEKIKTRMTC